MSLQEHIPIVGLSQWNEISFEFKLKIVYQCFQHFVLLKNGIRVAYRMLGLLIYTLYFGYPTVYECSPVTCCL